MSLQERLQPRIGESRLKPLLQFAGLCIIADTRVALNTALAYTSVPEEFRFLLSSVSVTLCRAHEKIEMMNNALQSSIPVNLLVFLLMLVTVAMPVGAASLGPVSEETPPASCDPGHFVDEVRCSGRYCDNIRIACRRLPDAVLGKAQWKRWVSEEHGGRDCGRNSFIAGLACKGSYCDEIALYCVEVTNLARLPSCEEVGPVSEERGGRLNFFGAMRGDKAGQTFLARSMRCAGRYCDNKYFTVCEL